MGAEEAGLHTVYQIWRHISSFWGLEWSLGWHPGPLPSGGGRDEKTAAEAGNWRESKLTHWKKLRQELGSEVTRGVWQRREKKP